ncbi:hypothetical protein LguiA_003380 [Lonicera macranthoides]
MSLFHHCKGRSSISIHPPVNETFLFNEASSSNQLRSFIVYGPSINRIFFLSNVSASSLSLQTNAALSG